MSGLREMRGAKGVRGTSELCWPRRLRGMSLLRELCGLRLLRGLSWLRRLRGNGVGEGYKGDGG